MKPFTYVNPTNEKDAVAATGRLDLAPAGFAEQAHGLLARLGTSPEGLTAALDAGAVLVARVSAACGRSV